MCGIVGYIGKKNGIPVLMEGLKRLEYRGYDSAGIAYIQKGKMKVIKREGKIAALEEKVPSDLSSHIGIAHTRWATHGGVNDLNAHPQLSNNGKIAVVHNGIIDNYNFLKKKLIKEGNIFKSETDTEVIAHLIEKHLAETGDPETAVKKTLGEIEGTYGLIVLFSDYPDILIGARNGSPLVVGVGEDEMFLASDVNAIVGYTKQVIYIEDRETVLLKKDFFSYFLNNSIS